VQPAASVAAPVVPVQPPEPQNITIKLTSIPDGAEVYVGDESAPRAKTPYELTLPRGDGETTVHFKLDGYLVKDKTVKTSRDAELEITLDKEPPKPEPVVVHTEPVVHQAPTQPTPVVHHTQPTAPANSAATSKPKVAKPDDDDVLAPSF
jgi:hypothetical protein